MDSRRGGRGIWRRLAVSIAIVIVASGCWSQYRGDWGHSGAQPFEASIARSSVSTLVARWVGLTGAAVDVPVSFGNGFAFAVARDGKLYAFDAAGINGCSGTPTTCLPLWTATVPDLFQSSPALAGGVAYVQGLDAVYAFDAAGVNRCSGFPKTCRPLWKSSPIGYAQSGPTVAYGTVYASGARGLNAFDAAGIVNCAGSPAICEPKWISNTFSPSADASPAVAAGSVYVSDGSWMYAFDAAGAAGCSGVPTTCLPRWRTGGAASSPAVVNGVLYLAGGATGLSAFDASGITNCAGTPRICAPLWSTTLSATTGVREPPAVANGVVYLPWEGSLYAFDAAGVVGCGGIPRLCVPRWRTALPPSGSGAITGAPMVANRVVFSGGSKRLTAYDATGGINCAALPKRCDPLWASAPSGAGYGAPVVFAGTVYAGTGDGIHAFRRSTSRAPAPRISGVSPRPVRGTITAVTVVGTGFGAGLSVSTTIPDAILSAPASVTSTGFTVVIAVPETAESATYALRVTNPDQGLATTSLAFDTTSGADVAARGGISADPMLLVAAPASQAADLDAITALGGKWMSLDVLWAAIQQGGRESFRWDELDTVVISARARGLLLIGTASYSPPWAMAPDCPASELVIGHCLPANPDDYAQFVGAAAARYGSESNAVANGVPLRDGITHWQLWNEPNNQQFARPKPDLDDYAALLKAGSLAIKATDPAATVITGGISPASDAADGSLISPETWLRGLYARGARGYFDAVAHHPYSFPTNPLEPHPWNAYTQTATLYSVMVEFGDASKKVWGTEVGVPTGTSIYAMTEAEQAQWAHDYYLGWNTTFAAFTGPLTWKGIRDQSADLGAVWENVGLLRYDRTEKPAYPILRSIMTNGFTE